MIVFKEDIDSGIDPLPVRNGCSGPCACSGFCRIIIGYIDRTKYIEFMTKFVSFENFIEANYVKETLEEENELREVLLYEVKNAGDKGEAKNKRYSIMHDLSPFLVSMSTVELYNFIVSGGVRNKIFVLPNKILKEEAKKILDQYFFTEWKTHYK